MTKEEATEKIKTESGQSIFNFLDQYAKKLQVLLKINSEGKQECAIIEIKPHKQTLPPDQPIKKNTKYINEVVTYTVNQAKFKAAQRFCEERNWRFMVLTEKDLGIKY